MTAGKSNANPQIAVTASRAHREVVPRPPRSLVLRSRRLGRRVLRRARAERYRRLVTGGAARPRRRSSRAGARRRSSSRSGASRPGIAAPARIVSPCRARRASRAAPALDAPGLAGVLRIGVLALPLLAVMASARPAEPDTSSTSCPTPPISTITPAFPRPSAGRRRSSFRLAPYNLQLAAFFAGLVTPDSRRTR